MIDGLNDRAVATAVRVIESKPHIHYRRALHRAGAIGDVRAVRRWQALRMDREDLQRQYDWEMMLKRDDNERVVAARMIADLAMLHPTSAADRRAGRRRVIFWIHEQRRRTPRLARWRHGIDKTSTPAQVGEPKCRCPKKASSAMPKSGSSRRAHAYVAGSRTRAATACSKRRSRRGPKSSTSR